MSKRRVVRRRNPDLDVPPDEHGIVLGIDPSLTALGVCALSEFHYRTWLVKPKKTGALRLREVQHALQDIFFEVGIENVDLSVIEGYSFGSKGTQAHKIGEGGGAIKLALLDTFGPKVEAGFPYIVAPSTLKKFTIGNGAAKKNEMLLGVYKKWGIEFTDDNEADAYALARWGWAFKYGTEIKYEHETLTKFEREKD